MTLEEAIELLKGMQNEKVDYAELVCAPAFAYGYEYVYSEPEDYAIEEAIEALKEVQQYRKIGTVEECKELASIVNKAERNELAKIIDEWIEYSKIGTVEECREAVEKQKPKKPKLNYKPRFLGKATYTCPKCGNCCLEEFANERQNNNYCWDCGQAIQWDENLEGMEDGA